VKVFGVPLPLGASIARTTAALLVALGTTTLAFSQAAAPASILFQNVRIFDGKDATLSAPSNVLVRGNTIEKISTSPIPVDRSANTQIIEGNGKTLIPGLIDAHYHMMFAAIPQAVALTADIGYVQLAAGREADLTLMRGFTTVRDLGGPPLV
jgi:imidazolonepropionase-like amidohydrolase